MKNDYRGLEHLMKIVVQEYGLAFFSYTFSVFQINASRPLRSSRLSSFCDGPLGCLIPSSHWRTVDGLVLSSDANTA
jgi:hypothetical protein